jgi:hypothetical protein
MDKPHAAVVPLSSRHARAVAFNASRQDDDDETCTTRVSARTTRDVALGGFPFASDGSFRTKSSTAASSSSPRDQPAQLSLIIANVSLHLVNDAPSSCVSPRDASLIAAAAHSLFDRNKHGSVFVASV